MRRDGTPIQALLLRTFLPAVVVVAVVLAALVYNWLYASIIDGFDRKLVTTSALTGALIDPQAHDRLMQAAATGANAETKALENGTDYLHDVEAMRRIRTQLDLTYLYTQALGAKPLEIFYVLDSSLGDEHSDIGSIDELTPETDVGLRKTEADGSIYVSPIEYQEQWGLLKTAAAPVLGGDGRIKATAGADVTISVIQVATQNALFASALIGIGSILACVAVALVIVRRVARPIAALRQEALRIAAGDAALPAPIRGPREVAGLRDALAALAGRMSERAAHNRQAAIFHEREADEAILAGRPLPAVPAPKTDAVVTATANSSNMTPIGPETLRNLFALGRIAPFDRLTESELLLISQHVRFRHFAADSVLLSGGSVADMLFIVTEGEVLAGGSPAPAIFDAPSALFGLPAAADYRAGPEGAGTFCLAKPHLFTIARECPDFIAGLAAQARAAP